MKNINRINYINWLFFTCAFGMFPLFFLMIARLFTGNEINLVTAEKEIFFLTIVLCADVLKTLNNSKKEDFEPLKAVLHGLSIIVMILSSVLYGVFLIYEIENFEIYKLSAMLCMISALVGGILHSIIEPYQNHSDKNTVEKLEFCISKTGMSKIDIIRKGINLVYKELKEKE